jgi:LPPG:FO 2-phospho-L-lactate transferase
VQRITVLAGGVGAARFLRGLRSLLEPSDLTVVVNTTDDDGFFGLHVSPDLDTVTYTLADAVDRERGWGLAGDSAHCLAALQRYYDLDWFRLGDRDLATHIYRSERLRRGRTLSQTTDEIRRAFGVQSRILPMSDQPVRSVVDVEGIGRLPFQQYLVKRGARGRVRSISFAGAGRARPAPGVLAALRDSDAVIIPPSNPLVSILPIVRLPGVRAVLRRRRAHVAAVSPLVGGVPIKGPLHRMLGGLGHEVSAIGVARLYRDFASVFVLDRVDAALAPRVAALGLRPVITDTIMRTPARSRRLAAAVLAALRDSEASS